MKKILLLLLSIGFLFVGCSDSDTDSLSESPVIELEVSPSGDAITSRRVAGKISTEGEVDRYHLNLVETGRILQIKCTSGTIRPKVDLLVHVFEQDADGNLRMIAGTHAPEDAIQPADLKINIYVDRPKELYIHVRDLKDDDSSDNTYYLTANYEAAPDGNGTFETAVSLTPGGDPQEEVIGTIGDVDCFSFSVTQSGVYDVLIDFDPVSGTDVKLSIDLYAPDGTLIETRDQGNNSTHLVHYLAATGAGETYKVVVDDDGKDDFDTMSTYEVSISQNSVNEVNTNDTPAIAMDAVPASFDGASIDYYEDIDWYKVEIPDGPGDIDIMALDFDSNINITYRLSMYAIDDSDRDTFNINDETPVYAHDFRSATDPPYHVILKLDTLGDDENYYLAVQPQNGASITGNSPYDASVSVSRISDPDEAGPGNDTDATAIDIPDPPRTHTGRISYRGDVDWFELTIDLSDTDDQVLSFALDIPPNNEVEYAMDIERTCRPDEMTSCSVNKHLRNTSSAFRSVDLKTGIVVPAQSHTSGEATYKIKVYDFQNDDGENTDYTLSWSIDTIPGVPSSAAVGGSAIYNDEQEERNTGSDGYTGEVTINYTNSTATFEYTTGTSFTYRVNNKMFDLDEDGAASTDGSVTTITMPWVSGYIDYQSDEDWYGVDLSEPYIDGDTDWYYEIDVELVAVNSDVEYVWDYFPDTDNNSIVNGGICSTDVWSDCNGIAANGGDMDPSQNSVNSSLSGDLREPDDEPHPTPWIGSRNDSYSWNGVVFFRVSDFNFMPSSGSVDPESDDDWGFDAPYFFRVILTYHSGVSNPNGD